MIFCAVARKSARPAGLSENTSHALAVTTALAAMPRSDVGYLVEATVTDVVAEVLVTVRRDPPIHAVAMDCRISSTT